MLRRWLSIGAGVLVGLAVITYAGYQFQDWWIGPTITISSPTSGATLEKPLIEIRGTAKRVAYLYLNGRQIYTNPAGEFEEQLLLSPGYNIITVSAEDKFNRTTQKRLQVILSATSTDPIFSYGQQR